jgi:hypothetical protein
MLRRRSGIGDRRDDRSPREKYEEFERESERWRERLEDALSELDELAREAEGDAAATRDGRS